MNLPKHCPGYTRFGRRRSPTCEPSPLNYQVGSVGSCCETCLAVNPGKRTLGGGLRLVGFLAWVRISTDPLPFVLYDIPRPVLEHVDSVRLNLGPYG